MTVVENLFTKEMLLWIYESGPHFFRHDVDYDLECATAMALFEEEIGIRSIYYLRSRAEEYHPASKAFRSATNIIRNAGHEIGIHADLGLERDAKVEVSYAVQCAHEQYSELGMSLGFEPHLSFHAPPSDALWRRIPGFRHAMSGYWADRYLADSRGVFRLDPRRHLIGHGNWQVNLHPEWWYLPWGEAQAMREREAVKP